MREILLPRTRKLALVFLFFATKLMGSTLFDFQHLKVERIRGDLYAFSSAGVRPTKLGSGDELGAGILLATGAGAIAVIDVPGPSMLYLGEHTRVYLRGATSNGLWVFSILKGKIIVKPKPGTGARPPNVISTVRNAKEGFLGTDYLLEFNPERQVLTARSAPVRRVSIPELTRTQSTKVDKVATTDEEIEGDIEDDIEGDVEDDVEADIEEAPVVAQRQKGAKVPRAELAPMSATEYLALNAPSAEAQSEDLKALESVEIQQDSSFSLDQSISARYSSLPKTDKEELNELDSKMYDYKYAWKSRYQKGNSGFIFNGWLENGSEDQLYASKLGLFDNKEIRRPILTANEVYYSLTHDKFDFSFGKKVIKNGFGIIFSPIDDVTPKDIYDPFDKRDLGNWTVQGDFYFDNITITAALIPFFRPNRQLPTPVLSPLNDNVDKELNFPSSTIPSTSLSNYLLRAKTTLNGWDLMGGIFSGYSTYHAKNLILSRDALSFPFPPREDIIINLDSADFYPKVNSIFAGFSTTVGPSVVYSDLKIQSPEKDGEDSSFYSLLLGVNRKFHWLSNLLKINDVTVYLEYSRTIYRELQEVSSQSINDAIERAKDGILVQPYSDTLFGFDTLSPRYFNNTLIFKSIFNVNDDLDLGLAGNIDFDPRENSVTRFNAFTYLYQISLDYKLYKNLKLTTTYEVRTELKKEYKSSYLEDVSNDNNSSICYALGKKAECDLQRLTFKLEYPF